MEYERECWVRMLMRSAQTGSDWLLFAVRWANSLIPLCHIALVIRPAAPPQRPPAMITSHCIKRCSHQHQHQLRDSPALEVLLCSLYHEQIERQKAEQ
ncbi:hypothetical protein AOLI_G00000170 [Acnodon oligacanthus]